MNIKIISVCLIALTLMIGYNIKLDTKTDFKPKTDLYKSLLENSENNNINMGKQIFDYNQNLNKEIRLEVTN